MSYNINTIVPIIYGEQTCVGSTLTPVFPINKGNRFSLLVEEGQDTKTVRSYMVANMILENLEEANKRFGLRDRIGVRLYPNSNFCLINDDRIPGNWINYKIEQRSHYLRLDVYDAYIYLNHGKNFFKSDLYG